MDVFHGRSSPFWLFLICIVFFILGIFRLNDVSVYTPDSARYLIWGNALAHGNGFVDDTQPEPEYHVLNAPLYAVLTAPVHLLFPLSVFAVKIYTLLWGILVLLFTYMWLQPSYGNRAALFATFVLAANPGLLFVSTEVLSETPFIALLLGSMISVERLTDSHGQQKRIFSLLILCTAFLPLLREVGFAWVGALAVHFAMRRRWKSTFMVLLPALLLFGLWYVRNAHWSSPESGEFGNNLTIASQHIVTPTSSSMIAEYATRFWFSLRSYGSYLGGMIFYPLWSPEFASILVHSSNAHKIIGFLLFKGTFLINSTMILLVGMGILFDVHRSPTAFLRLTFIAFFLFIVCIYPVHDIRFLAPLLPLILFYLMGGISWLRKHFSLIHRLPFNAWAFAALGCIVLPDAVGIQQMILANIEYRQSPQRLLEYSSVPLLYRYQWNTVEQWIQSHVADSVVFASPFKDIALVAGNRKVLELDPNILPPVFESMLRDYHVEYVFAIARWSDLRDFEFQMRESRHFWFEPVQGMPNLMRVHSRVFDTDNMITPHQEFDTTRNSELLRKGRSEIVRGEYPAAVKTLRRAFERVPDQPEILYQSMIVSLMSEDSASASFYLHQLLGLTQSMSWTSMARMHLDAFQLLMRAQKTREEERRDILRQEAATLYWRMGYFRRAAEILLPLVQEKGSGYFIGLLWGLHYHLQIGNTGKAQLFLNKLNDIDSMNTLVQSYHHIVALGDSLYVSHSDVKKSAYHLSLARLYQEMDLPEEALDEIDRALKAQSGDIDALSLQAQIFNLKKRPLAALRTLRQLVAIRPEDARARVLLDSLTLQRSKR